MSTSSIVLALASLTLDFCLGMIVLKRRPRGEFPFFLTYLALSAIAVTVGLAVMRSYSLYYYSYWTFEALYSVLGLLALHEAFRLVFRNFFRIYPWLWWLFPSVIVMVLLLSSIYAVQRPAKQVFPVIRIILYLEIALNVMRAGLFLLFRGAAWFFRARRRDYAMGIVDGFAVMAGAAGLIYGLRSEFGTRLAPLVQYGVPVAYIIAQIIWLDTFLRAQEPRPQLPAGMTLEQALDEMARNTEWVKDLSRRLGRRE